MALHSRCARASHLPGDAAFGYASFAGEPGFCVDIFASQRGAAEAAAAAHPTSVPRSLSMAMERIDEDGPALLGRGERRGPAGAHPLRVAAEGGRGRRGSAPVGRAAELERDRGADRQRRA